MLERTNGPTGRRRPWNTPGATPYEILDVDEGASPATIRRAYLHLVQIWHPDRFPKNSARQQEAEFATTCINEAYLALRSSKRARSGRFHRTPRSPRTSLPAQDWAKPTRSVWDPADWDGRRILPVGLIILVVVIWLIAAALLFWALIEWY